MKVHYLIQILLQVSGWLPGRRITRILDEVLGPTFASRHLSRVEDRLEIPCVIFFTIVVYEGHFASGLVWRYCEACGQVDARQVSGLVYFAALTQSVLGDETHLLL